MTAGLFRAHGVFFGQCQGPSKHNAKGFLENRWLKQTLQAGRMTGWPDTWFERLGQEGWNGGPWGAKMMPKWWPFLRDTGRLAVVVLCYRPEKDILASCARVKWERSIETVRERWAMMDHIRSEATCPVFRVDTDRIINDDLRQLEGAFDALGLELSPRVAREWVDPRLWHAA